MRIIVVGIGLIGGSFCKAIKKYTDHHVIGMDISDESLELALAMESIDEIVPMTKPELLVKGDLVLVCIPPYATVDFILKNKDYFRKGAIVSDVCGVKEHIVNQVTEPLRQAGVDFIGTHPMAGREFSGFVFSLDNLFVNASFLITPTEGNKKENIDILKKLAEDIGFRTILETNAKQHDASIAYTSQLAHVVSNAYIKSPGLKGEKGFSANSFLDMTRVARLDENMWSDLFLLNRDNLLREIDILLVHIEEHRDALVDGDRERIRQMLKAGRELKERNSLERKTL